MNRHVLFIVENQAVPYDRRVWLEACAIKEQGCKVSIISIKNEKASKSYETLNGIEIYRHPLINYSLGKLGFLIEYLVALFYETILSFKVYAKAPFSIIHSANPPDTVFFIAWIFKLLKVKYIFDHHDLAPELYQAKFKKGKTWLYYCLLWLENISCKTADVIISTNESYKKIVVDRHNLDRNKIFVVRNDPKISATGMNNCSLIVNDRKCILYLGTINRQDGVSTLLKVMELLVYKYDFNNILCKIIGDGECLSEIKMRDPRIKIEQLRRIYRLYL